MGFVETRGLREMPCVSAERLGWGNNAIVQNNAVSGNKAIARDNGSGKHKSICEKQRHCEEGSPARRTDTEKAHAS